ncbi:pyridoxal phosphate-dependent aminotransferase family protein, partial [Campylobacter coli]|nr:pyridoxal phosphate-dependent aminotransferase family protein [Campylobacter coli]
NIAWTKFIFEKMSELKEKREKLQIIGNFFKNQLIEKSHQILGDAYIISLVLGENQKAIELAKKLEVNGIFAPAIKEPTVPKNTARIRFSLHAGLSKEDLKKVVELL